MRALARAMIAMGDTEYARSVMERLDRACRSFGRNR
jgi:hypothetical protein